MFFSWVWNSGSTVNGSDANWGGEEPDNINGGQDCLTFLRSVNYLLDDLECDRFRGGICQIPPE